MCDEELFIILRERTHENDNTTAKAQKKKTGEMTKERRHNMYELEATREVIVKANTRQDTYDALIKTARDEA